MPKFSTYYPALRRCAVAATILLMCLVACTSTPTKISEKERKEAARRVKHTAAVPDSLAALEKTFNQEGNAIGRMIAFREWGKLLRNESRFDEALQVHSEGLHLAETLNDTLEWIQALNNIGTNYRRLGILDAAQEYHYTAWKMSEVSADTSFSAQKNRVISLNGLGNIYMTLGNLQRADSIFRLALAGEKKLKSGTGQAINYANLGAIFRQRHQLDSAWVYFRKSMQLNEREHNKIGISLCHNYFGELYEAEKDYVSAYREYEAALSIMKASKDDWHAMPTLIALAHIDYVTGKIDNALATLQKAEATARRIKSKEHLAEIYNLYYLIYYKQGAYQQALTHHLEATALKDSVAGAEKTNRIQNISLNIERRRQAELVTRSEQALSQERSRRYLTLGIGITLFALVGSFALMLFYTQRIRSRAYQSLKKMSLLRENFFTNITHEFRTPLTVILGLSNEIATDPNAPKTHQSKAQNIHQQGKNLLTFVNQLLDISKIKSSVGDPDWRHGNLSAYIEMIVESYRPFAQTRQISLQFSSPQALHTDFVPDYVNKIMNNLLSNAFKFTPQYGKITVSLSGTSQTLQLTIADTGKGIAPAHLPHLFELFYQVQGENRHKGSGIGLSLVKQIVESLEGTIRVESEEGKGTVFVITMPIHHSKQIKAIDEADSSYAPMLPQEAATLVDSPIDEEDNGSRILIVEDNTDIAAYIGSLLTETYAVFYASDGKEGIEKAKEVMPDLIITDLMMPVMNGWEVCKQVRADQVLNHIPIVVVTAKITDADRLKGYQVGADAYLAKPFNADELTTLVEKLLEQRRRLREKFQLLDLGSNSIGEISTSETANKEEDNTEEAVNNGKADQLFLLKIVDTIYLSLDRGQEIDLDTLAGKMCMSRRQFYRKVMSLTGYSPIAYVQRVKIRKAVAMLQKDTNISLKEVSEECGFSDYSNFVRAFKNVEGITPTQYVHQLIYETE